VGKGVVGFPAGLQNEPGVSRAQSGPGCARFDKTKPSWFVSEFGVAGGGRIGGEGKETSGPLVSEPGAGVARSFDGTFAEFAVFIASLCSFEEGRSETCPTFFGAPLGGNRSSVSDGLWYPGSVPGPRLTIRALSPIVVTFAAREPRGSRALSGPAHRWERTGILPKIYHGCLQKAAAGNAENAFKLLNYQD